MNLATPTRRSEAHRHNDRALERMVQRHEELERMIAARRSHGLATGELWSAMVAIESRLADDHPRAHSFWIAEWALRRPVAQHRPGQHHPHCPICRTASV